MCVTSLNTYHTGRCFEQKLQMTTQHTMAGVHSFTKSRSHFEILGAGGWHEANYIPRTQKNSSPAYKIWSREQCGSRGLCAPLVLRPTQLSCVSLAVLGANERYEVPPQNSRNADWFCSQFIPRVLLAPIKPIHQSRRKGPCGPSSAVGPMGQRGPPHEQESKFVISFGLDSVLHCLMIKFLLAPCNEMLA
jgi:hypothetical protein